MGVRDADLVAVYVNKSVVFMRLLASAAMSSTKTMIHQLRIRPRRVPATLIVLALLFGAPIVQSDAGEGPTRQELERLINDAAQKSSCIGLAIGVKSGRTVATGFLGTTGNNGAPTADTEFEIGSITKTFTTTLLAWADQQGRMRLNEPLAKFALSRIPHWQGEPIRLVHLADHTSGLPRQMPSLPPRLMPEDVWAFLARYQLTRPPGAQYVYSNVGVNALGLAIERAHRASLEQLYAQVIAGPLGMTDTAMQLTDAQHARLALGFTADRQRASEFTPGFPFVGGASALRSTLRDMMRYLAFELGEGRSPLDSLLPVLHHPRHPADQGNVGLGWNIRTLGNGIQVVWKDGLMPGYSSYINFAPSSRTGSVVLANQARCGVGAVAAELITRLNGLVPDPAEPVPSSGDD
jgi:D-alanyl-D-alanine-carboxypeptidase/D-alanyl-D-alanine-endopeptidase